MRLHHSGQVQQAVFQQSLRCFLRSHLTERLPAERIQLLTVHKIEMILIEIRKNCRKFFICFSKIQSVDTFKRQKYDRIPVHPFFTQAFLPGNRKSFKQLSAIFPDIKKFRQHTHAQSLSEPARTRNQRNLPSVCPQQFPDQTALINIVISIFPDIRKSRSSNRYLYLLHD